MAKMKKTELVVEHRFDPKACRHTLNGSAAVFHCHHFTTLYSQLADDCALIDAKKLMAEVAEDTFYEILKNYYAEYGVSKLEDRIAIAEEYYAYVGMGQMKVISAGADSGEVDLLHSHVDEGWIKKWGKRAQPVNFFTQGYISALFAAAMDRAPRSFSVTETESIVSGAKKSSFQVVSK